MVYWSGWQTGHHTSVQWYSSCHDNFNQPWTYIPGWLISSVSLAVSVLLRLASLSTDGTSSSIRLLCHASILSALVYSQGRNQSKTKPGFPADSRKKSIDRIFSPNSGIIGAILFFQRPELAGNTVLCRHSNRRPSILTLCNPSGRVDDTSTFFFETESYASTRRTHLLFTANQHSSWIARHPETVHQGRHSYPTKGCIAVGLRVS